MEYVTMNISELSGAALDWAVATGGGRITGFNLGGGLQVRGRTEEGEELPDAWDLDLWYEWHPSTDWEQGGPIIEREKISVGTHEDYWSADITAGEPGFIQGHGPTPLIAAMRCYVASKLGDKIDVPLPLIG